MKKENAFTLIELLVVISIIIILIGLTSAGIRAAMKKAKQQKAKTECLALLSAVNRFYSETGIYPQDSSGNGKISEDVLGKKLSKHDIYNSSSTTLVFGPYYEFKKTNSTGTIGVRDPADPWGRAYKILLPSEDASAMPTEPKTANKNGFVIIYSQGPDNSTSDDDIGTWQ